MSTYRVGSRVPGEVTAFTSHGAVIKVAPEGRARGRVLRPHDVTGHAAAGSRARRLEARRPTHLSTGRRRQRATHRGAGARVSELSLDPTDWLPHRPAASCCSIPSLSIEPGRSRERRAGRCGRRVVLPRTLPGTTRPRRASCCWSRSPSAAPSWCSPTQRYAGRLPLFGGVEHARFRRQVVPGDTVDSRVRDDASSPREEARAVGRATVDGVRRRIEAELFFVLADAP